MTQNSNPTTKKTSPPPIIFILLGLVLAGGMYWLMMGKKTEVPQPAVTVQNPQSTQDRMSLGGKLLVTARATSEKQAGVQAFAAGDYGTAVTQFQAALQKNRNDPETLIYLNNSRVGNGSGLKVAVSVPIGSNLNVSQEILRGVAQAQDQVNQHGGINGSKLQVEIVNDENDPEIVKQVAAELVKSQVLAVVGHNASDATLAAAPVYQQGGLVAISPTSSANSLSGFGSYIFRIVPTMRSMAEPLAQYVVRTGHKTNMAVCYDSQSSDSFKEEFVASLLAKGGKLVPTVCDFSSPTFNPSTVISQAVSNGADSLLLSPHVDRLNQALDLAKTNKGRLALFSSPTLYTIKTVESGHDVNGLVLPVPWHPAAISASPFLSEARKLWGGVVSWRTAMAYDATRAIIVGLQHNTRDGLQRALRNPGFSATGAGEEVKFLPTGDRLGTPILVEVKPVSSGYDFVPVRP